MEYNYSSLAKRRREDTAANNGQAVPSSVLSANAKDEEEDTTSSDDDEEEELLGKLIYNSSRTAQLRREQQQRQDKVEEEEVPKKKRILKSFEQRIQDIRAYKEEHGHVNVKGSEDKSLNKFCHHMRYARNNPGKSDRIINEKRIASLDALGFDWSVRTTEQPAKKSFEQRIEDLRAYKEKHGHINVKQREDRSLYKFCGHMKHDRNNPEKSTYAINNDRIASLDALGFDWAVNDQRVGEKRKSFKQRVEDLQGYKEKHGHVSVKMIEDKSLYDFCKKMRYARKNPEKSTTVINDDRIASLDALGCDWFVKEQAGKKSFAQRIDDLQAYKEKHGHIRVKQSDDKSLYIFCSKMRYTRKKPEKSKMALTDDRIASLDALGFDWAVK